MTEIPTISGDELRQIRTELKLSQEAFGALMGAARTTVWQWENGRRKPDGSVAQLARLTLYLHRLDMSPAQIFRKIYHQE